MSYVWKQAEEINGFFSNGFAIASQTEGETKDPRWPICLACAIIDRQLKRSGMKPPVECLNCFSYYCAPE